ncbi:hypothetical protein F9868_04890 [Glaesserella parasuis]|nr:hypothetical protein [Glaesserella parasuis]MDE3971142.1 hypothetical protein [Glaesserella parasuis]MDE3992025.1 hypothetical protein [Glaesserella parasuis]MDE4055057.1 hypothetical protein [Glaesserella parasuis]MDO9975239.1 hypothetical protein [Glaesserella parasuis]
MDNICGCPASAVISFKLLLALLLIKVVSAVFTELIAVATPPTVANLSVSPFVAVNPLLAKVTV